MTITDERRDTPSVVAVPSRRTLLERERRLRGEHPAGAPGTPPQRRRDARAARAGRRPRSVRGSALALSALAGFTAVTGGVVAFAGPGDAIAPVHGWWRRHAWHSRSGVTLTLPSSAPSSSAGPSASSSAPAATTVPASVMGAPVPAAPLDAGTPGPTGTRSGSGAPVTAAPTTVPADGGQASPSSASASSSASGPAPAASSVPPSSVPPSSVPSSSVPSSASSSPARATASTAASSVPVPAVSSGRRGLWIAIGQTPTAAQLDAAPGLYSVVVLNVWQTAALHALKAKDPSIVVLMYKDLSSVRSYDTSATPPSGVTWSQATANPSWFATDSSGNRIEWSGYSGHWQTAVWDPGYQAAWTQNVVAAATADQWDGVLADNDVSTLKWYSGALLAGTGSAAQTDAKLRDGLGALLATAGKALNARGKRLVPNVSDARLYPGRWTAHTTYGGGMEENFVHFTTGEAVTDWGATGWVDQTAEMSSSGLSLAVTRTTPGDAAGQLYGYASLLVRGDEDAFWMPGTGDASYAAPQSIPELAWRTGAPAGAAVRLSSGAWTRGWQGVWAAVNPTTSTVTVPAPSGAKDASGAAVTTLRLGPATGAVLRLG